MDQSNGSEARDLTKVSYCFKTKDTSLVADYAYDTEFTYQEKIARWDLQRDLQRRYGWISNNAR